MEYTEGVCQMCQRRPAQYLGLVCYECKAAVDNNEEWTTAYDDVLFQLRQLEEEEEYR